MFRQREGTATIATGISQRHALQMKNFIIWVILLGVVAYGGSKLYLHNEVGKAVDMVVLQLSPFADVEYDGVASTLSGELTVEGIRVRVTGYSDYLTIDRMGIDTPSFLSLLELGELDSRGPDAMPEYLGFLIEGLRVPVDADYFEDVYEFSLAARNAGDSVTVTAECTGRYGFSPAALSALGYREQVMSMMMVMRDEETRYSFEIDISLADMWDLDADIAMAGNMIAELSKGMAYQPRLHSMQIEVTDRSLNGRVADYCARQGLSAAETLQAQVDTFRHIGAANGIEFDQYIVDPYKEFLGGKSTLVLTAQPTNPVAFSQIDLYKPSDVPALLNLAAAAR